MLLCYLSNPAAQPNSAVLMTPIHSKYQSLAFRPVNMRCYTTQAYRRDFYYTEVLELLGHCPCNQIGNHGPKATQALSQGSSVCSRISIFSMQLYSPGLISKKSTRIYIYIYFFSPGIQLLIYHKYRGEYDKDEGFRFLSPPTKSSKDLLNPQAGIRKYFASPAGGQG